MGFSKTTALITSCWFGAASVALADDAPTELACSFTSECMTGETCEDTSFIVAVVIKTIGKSPLVDVVEATLTSDAETLILNGFEKDGTFSVSGGAVFPASHHLTANSAGAALYTTHFSGDFGITYIGACE